MHLVYDSTGRVVFTSQTADAAQSEAERRGGTYVNSAVGSDDLQTARASVSPGDGERAVVVYDSETDTVSAEVQPTDTTA